MSVDTASGEVLAPRTDLPSVQEALCSAAKACGAVPKDDENKQQGFRYRGIERILRSAGPALTAAGVVVIPRVVHVERETMERGANHTVWRLVTLTVEYQFVGPAGDCLTAAVLGEGLDQGDKAVSKAHTMAWKTVLLQALKVGDADTDPDAETPPEQVRREVKKPKLSDKPSPAEMEAKVAREHGEDHVRLIGGLVKSMDTLEPEKRKATKAEFVGRFGNPWELTPDALVEARDWLLHVLSPAPEPITGGAP